MLSVVFIVEKGSTTSILESFGFDTQCCIITEKTPESLVMKFFREIYRLNRRNKTDIRLMATKRMETRFFNIDDVIYISSRGRLMEIRSSRDSFEFNGTLNNIEKKLSMLGFIRIHQSYLISVEHIRSSTADYVEMDDGKRINVGEKYAPAFRKTVAGMVDIRIN
ncbi:MAG: LytTR family transcriptional regulator [Parasporobacterium sp.]|nr:LytTR family transcriptional regulator [Parasporobacterium sp.]